MPFQTIEQQHNYDPNGILVENHELAKELRELYDLHSNIYRASDNICS